MQVTVNPAPNKAPTANTGADITITLPTNSTSLNGIGTDIDGTITIINGQKYLVLLQQSVMQPQHRLQQMLWYKAYINLN